MSTHPYNQLKELRCQWCDFADAGDSYAQNINLNSLALLGSLVVYMSQNVGVLNFPKMVR